MSLPDGAQHALKALKSEFEGRSAIHPTFRHVLTESSSGDYFFAEVADEFLPNFAVEPVYGAEGFARILYGHIMVREIPGNRSDSVCRTHFFLDDDHDHIRRVDAFQAFWMQAKRGVEIMCESGRLEPKAAPDPGFLIAYENHWCARWMEVVYRFAREGHPFGLRVVTLRSIRHMALPGSSTASELNRGVFSSSAWAIDCILNEGGDQAPCTPTPETSAVKTDPTEASGRQPEGKQAHEGSAETTMTPGSLALAAAYQLRREGKRVSVKAAAELAGVDRSHLTKKYPEAVAAIKKLAAPDHALPRGEKDGRTGTMEAWEGE